MPFLLVLTILLPAVGSLLLACRTGRPAEESRAIALGFAGGTLALTLILLVGFQPDLAGPQFAFGGGKEPYGLAWMGAAGPRFAFGLDGISVGLFALTAVLGVTAVTCSWEAIRDRAAANYALLLALLSGLLGLFASLDVILFYVFFEFTLIPLFFLIGIFGGVDRKRASLTFFLYTLAGSLLTLLGVIALVAIHHSHSPDHDLTFSMPELTTGLASIPWSEWRTPLSWTNRGDGFWSSPQVVVFLLLFAGFAAKLALFPFHTWQPLAYSEAPTGATILLAGAALKVGCYGLLRFNLAMTPLGAAALAPLVATLATIAILYGALAALAQHDLKRLIAYSSISHMGFVVLGLFSLNSIGIEGATIQMVNHGLTTGALFACVGLLTDRYRTRDIAEMGGLWNKYPVWSFFLIIAALGSAALPGLNGFIGEFPILLGMYQSRPTTTVWATLGMILGAYYLLWMLQRVVFGPLVEPTIYAEAPSEIPTDTSAKRPDLGFSTVELAGIVPLIVLIVLIGILPAPFIDRIKPPIVPIAAHLQVQPAIEELDAGPDPTEVAVRLPHE